MGTNFYFRFNMCDCCDRYDEIHIGKSSGGWQFLFQFVNQTINPKRLDPKSALLNEEKNILVVDSFKKWKTLIDRYVVEYKTAKIYNEYNEEVSASDLYELIESKRDGINHHRKSDDRDSFEDDEGNSFIRCDFS